ncbi:MAG: Hsp70 family protein [Myxococcota bacterium]|nr:Hsp70 family protein [Myxococcota bacterium]
MTEPAFGLDFGTTNSAIARVGPDGTPTLASFASDAGPTSTFRSVLYFDQEEGPETRVRGGPAAIEGYLESEEKDGRLVQSLKSFLASRLFSATNIFQKTWRLEDLIGALLAPLRLEAEAEFGEPVERVVVGRPVNFVHAENADDERLALARLEASLHNAGFRHVVFEYEPVGAAYHYERGLEHDELILIADFGGGTSDFSLLRVGPRHAEAGRRAESILGHDGVGVAGDAFDGKLVRHLVAPQLGRGASFVSQFGRTLPVPAWIYSHLERWHHVSFLKSRKTLQLLLDLRREAIEPEKLERLLHVVEEDLGFLLYRATEQAKRDLSEADATTLRLDHEGLCIEAPVERADFEGWIADELLAISGCLDRILDRAGLQARDVDRVFLTGGSSFVPAVRRIFEERFGQERLRSGQQLTSVASGLALRAAEVAKQ